MFESLGGKKIYPVFKNNVLNNIIRNSVIDAYNFIRNYPLTWVKNNILKLMTLTEDNG